jgi:hypothetical protein
MSEIVYTIAKIAVTEVISNAIDKVAEEHKIPPFHIASRVDGVVHSHPPCDYKVDGCTYCERNGNFFSDDKDERKEIEDDVISKYEDKISDILNDLYEEMYVIAKEQIERKIDEEEMETEEVDLDDMLCQAFGLTTKT